MSRSQAQPRQQILDAAIRVFAERGFAGATIRQVGQSAHCNSALLYYYFEDKQTLYFEAVRRVVLDLLDWLKQHLHPFTNARDRVSFLVNGIFDYYLAHPERMELMGSVHTQNAQMLARVIQEVFQENLPVPFRVLQEGMQRGELKSAHPAHLWWIMLGTAIFTLHMHETFRSLDRQTLPVSLPNLDQSRAEIIALLCNGLVCETTSSVDRVLNA